MCCKPGSNLICQVNTTDHYIRAVSWRFELFTSCITSSAVKVLLIQRRAIVLGNGEDQFLIRERLEGGEASTPSLHIRFIKTARPCVLSTLPLHRL